MGMIPEELEKGPWEGHDVCSTCLQDLSAQDYYLNKCVCHHCGACNASGDGSQGLTVIVRRKLFFGPKHKYKAAWWRDWLALPVRKREFDWEIKETDG